MENLGTAKAENVVVTDKVPDGLKLIKGSISEGGVLGDDGVTITWNLGTMVGLAKTEVSFKVRVPDVTNYTLWKNVAAATYDDPNGDPENPPEPSESEEV